MPGYSMKFRSIILPVMLLVTVGVTGCDHTGKKANEKPADAAAYSTSARPDAVSAAKLDLYSQAYKIMMSGQTSLKPSFDGFVTRLKNTRNNEEILYISGGRLEYALELFRQGYAIDGGDMPELDRNVLAIINAGNSLMAKRAGQEPIEGNQKENDSPDRATDGTSPLPSGYEALFAAMDRMETLLFKYRKNESVKRMALYRDAGNPLGFYTERSLAEAQDLLALFIASKNAINDSETYDKGDLVLSSLEESLAAQRRAYVNARSEEVEGLENYPAVYRVLTSMAGSYRDLRQNRTLSDLSALNKKYNEAIKANNRVSMLAQ